MKMQSPTIFFKRIRTQLPHSEVALPKTRLILYSITFLTSLLSALFFIVALIHHTRTLSEDPAFRSHDSMNPNLYTLMSVVFIPLVWSAVWSIIVYRSLLKAISHSPSPTAATSSAAVDPEALSTSVHITDPPEYQSHRRCCGCTCDPWLSPSHGPHPVLSLVMEVLLWPILLGIGFWFSFLFSNVSGLIYGYGSHCSSVRRRPSHYCMIAYKEIESLELTALIILALNIVVHLALFIIACVLVHRWRGETGARKEDNGQRRKGRSCASIDAVDGGRWIELDRGRDGK